MVRRPIAEEAEKRALEIGLGKVSPMMKMTMQPNADKRHKFKKR
jgi:hypothetical protein